MKPMSTPDFKDRLLQTDLTDLTVKKSALVQHATAHRHQVAADFFRSLPDDAWPADSFIRSFDDNPQYEALIASMTEQEVIVLRRTIRNLIADCTTDAMEERHFAGEVSDLTRANDIREHVRDLIRMTMDEAKFERMTRMRPVDLTTTKVSVSRLVFVLRKMTDETCAERQAALSHHEAAKASSIAFRTLQPPATPAQELVVQEIIRGENVAIAAARASLGFAEREKQLATVARQMTQENIGTTDVHFFATEMQGRLRDIDPENADHIMDRFIEIMSKEIGSALARNELKISGRSMTEEEQLEIRNAWRSVAYHELDKLIHPEDFAS